MTLEYARAVKCPKKICPFYAQREICGKDDYTRCGDLNSSVELTGDADSDITELVIDRITGLQALAT